MSASAVDYNRQMLIFNPDQHRERLGSIALIGVGAIGSAMALTLAKMGIDNFTMFDHDVVEVHNVPNQLLYSSDDAGEHKVSAAHAAIGYLTQGEHAVPLGISGQLRRARVQDVEQFDTIIVATDSLASRNVFWTAAATSELLPLRYLDLRMGGLVAQCYAASRADAWKLQGENVVAKWPQQFVDFYTPLVDGSKPADHDPCGARSFLPTALLAAAMGGTAIATWGRGYDNPMGVTLSFECPSDPFSITVPLET